MNYSDIKEGMRVHDPLSSLGYGEVVRVCKKTVWVKFYGHRHGGATIYDLEHLQFLNSVDKP